MSDEHKPIYDYTYHVDCRDCDTKSAVRCNLADIREYLCGNATATEALPYLSREDREILISGMCPRCYAFEDDDDVDDERFAVVGWSINDAMALEGWPANWEKEEAIAFLNEHADIIRDRLMEVGWEILESHVRIYKANRQKVDIKPEEQA